MRIGNAGIIRSMKEAACPPCRPRGGILFECRGQAAAEMAIFGVLILICFSVLLTYGQRFDTQQQLKAEAFRRALKQAFYRNSGASYTIQRDQRFYSLMGNFGEGQPSTMSASASVMWQKGLPGGQGSTDETSFAYYQVNDEKINGAANDDVNWQGLQRRPKEVVGISGDTQDVMVPESVWRVDTNKKVSSSNLTSTKEEQAEGATSEATIINRQNSDTREEFQTAVYTRWDDSRSDARHGPGEGGYVPPTYTYNNNPTNYDFEAYQDDATNRIKYRDDTGAPVHKERSWTTEYE